MRSDVEGSYEELEKELLEYLAMIDQQNRKAIGNFNSVEDSADHNDQEEPIFEYTEPCWDDSYQGWLCAVSEANPQKREKYRIKLRRPHLTMSALAKERVRARARAKRKSKERRGLATIAVSKDTLHESIHLLKGTLASSRSSGTTGGPRAKAQTNVVEKEVCPS